MTNPQAQTDDVLFDSIEDALAEYKAGHAVIVVDDENRENEGDLVCAAQFVTPEMINFMAVKARGLICLAMTGERLDELELPLMVTNNTDSNQTAFTVSVDASPALGVTTGISAEDRAKTIQVAINRNTKPEDLHRPGHIFPLRAKSGGVLRRAGHTESAIDLAELSGLYPAGVICEIQNDDGSMARLPELVDYAKEHQLKMISIADLISYRLKHERFVHRETIAQMPTEFGEFEIYAYRNKLDDSEHVAIVKGNPKQFTDKSVMVRVHSECLTGDAIGSMRCDCRMQLQAALKMIEAAGEGVVVYLRQEGRGIGLINKLKAYSLQDMGLDTVEANERLGFPADLRNYGVGAQILNDLGIHRIRLITNNPRKIAGLKGYGLEVVDRVPLLIEANLFNMPYLTTKAEKLGHMLLQTYLVTLAFVWKDPDIDVHRQYERLEGIRKFVMDNGLLVQEEARPVAKAIFQKPNLVLHIGLDQPEQAGSDWFKQPQHPYLKAIAALMKTVKDWSFIERVEFLVAPGADSLKNLQAKLDRVELNAAELHQFESLDLSTQMIFTATL